MDGYTLGFAIIGFLASLILFIDHNLQSVCMTRGCSLVRKSKYSRIFGFSNTIFGLFAFGYLAFTQIWYFNYLLTGIISGLGTIYAIYFSYLSIKKLDVVCPFCTVANISMLLIFLIWLNSFVLQYFF